MRLRFALFFLWATLSTLGSADGRQASSSIPKTVLVLQNHPFDPMGNLEPVLHDHGFAITVLQLPQDQALLAAQDPLAPDLLIVLGGSPGAYETDKYPFLQKELDLLQARLQKKRPSLGICLGAQLIARALGARVYAGPVTVGTSCKPHQKDFVLLWRPYSKRIPKYTNPMAIIMMRRLVQQFWQKQLPMPIKASL